MMVGMSWEWLTMVIVVVIVSINHAIYNGKSYFFGTASNDS